MFRGLKSRGVTGVIPRGRGSRHAAVEEVYERDDMAREARMEERLRRMETRFEGMFTTLFERFDAMSVGDHPRNRQPNNRP